MHRPGAIAVVAVVAATIVSGCSEQDGRVLRDPNPSQTDTITQQTTTTTLPPGQRVMTVSAPWAEGQPIDVRYTCDGPNVSPSLTWADAPAGTMGYAVVLTDIDAPEYAHWVVANIPATITSLPEAFADPIAVFAMNSAGAPAYAGPCPPKGTTHSYDLTVYALSQTLEAQTGDPAPSLIAAIESAALEAASTGFTFAR